MDEGEPFAILCNTIEVLPSKDKDPKKFSVLVRVKKYQSPDSVEDEEPVGEDLDGCGSGGEQDADGALSSSSEREESGSSSEKKRKKSGKKGGRKKKRSGPKMTKADRGDDLFTLVGPLCSLITSPLLQLELQVACVPREHNLFDLCSIEKAFIKTEITVNKITDCLKKTRFFGYSESSPDEKRRITKRIKEMFAALKTESGVVPETLLTREYEQALNIHISDSRMKNTLNNIFKDPEFFKLANKLGPDVVRLLSDSEIRDLSVGMVEVDFAELYGRLCFQTEFTEDLTEIFLEVADVSQSSKEGEAYPRIMAFYEASRIYHKMNKEVDLFKNGCLYEPREKKDEESEPRWSDGAVEILRQKKDSLFIYRDTLMDRKVVQPIHIKKDLESLAQKLLTVGSIVMSSFDVDDDTGNIRDKDGYFTHVFEICKSEKGRILPVTSVRRRKEILKESTETEFFYWTDVRKDPAAHEDVRAVIIDRAHLMTPSSVVDLLGRIGSPVQTLYLIGNLDCYPNSPGSWFRDLWFCDLPKKTNRGEHRLGTTNQTKIGGYYGSLMEFLMDDTKRKRCTIMVSNADAKREALEIIKESQVAGCQVKTVFKLDFEDTVDVSVVIDLRFLSRSSLLKCMGCTRMNKGCVSIIGTENELEEIYGTKCKRRMSNFGYIISKAHADEMHMIENPLGEPRDDPSSLDVEPVTKKDASLSNPMEFTFSDDESFSVEEQIAGSSEEDISAEESHSSIIDMEEEEEEDQETKTICETLQEVNESLDTAFSFFMDE